MYAWYKNAGVCLVFLPDVTAVPVPVESEQDQDTILSIPGHSSFKRAEFVESTWFTRGWTLQELIAPRLVLFYDTSLRTLGSIHKSAFMPKEGDLSYTLHNAIAEAARMDVHMLQSTLPRSSIATIISWVGHRQTARAEDMAYCLLGLCQVNMPLLYGEGGDRAFRRLQLEIISSHQDLSIFGFDQGAIMESGILATRPSQFSGSASEDPGRRYELPSTWMVTLRGLEFEVRIPRGQRHRYPHDRSTMLPLKAMRAKEIQYVIIRT